MASTFTHNGIPVTLPDGLSEKKVLDFYPFTSWIEQFDRSLALQTSDPSHPFHEDPYRLRSVTIQAYDIFGGGQLGFLKLQSDVRNAADEWLPGSVFLRGPSVAMMVILAPEDQVDERYVLMTVQPRVAAGSLGFVELPAGMVDEQGQFAGTAAREIREELGLEIPARSLTNLSDLAAVGVARGAENLPTSMYPSPGGCDEYIPIYMHERRVPRSQLSEWTGRLTGLRDNGEKITLKLVRMEDLWREGARDGKALAALALWENLRRTGALGRIEGGEEEKSRSSLSWRATLARAKRIVPFAVRSLT